MDKVMISEIKTQDYLFYDFTYSINIYTHLKKTRKGVHKNDSYMQGGETMDVFFLHFSHF